MKVTELVLSGSLKSQNNDRNYNKILASDWLSPATIFALIGPINW